MYITCTGDESTVGDCGEVTVGDTGRPTGGGVPADWWAGLDPHCQSTCTGLTVCNPGVKGCPSSGSRSRVRPRDRGFAATFRRNANFTIFSLFSSPVYVTIMVGLISRHEC